MEKISYVMSSQPSDQLFLWDNSDDLTEHVFMEILEYVYLIRVVGWNLE